VAGSRCSATYQITPSPILSTPKPLSKQLISVLAASAMDAAGSTPPPALPANGPAPATPPPEGWCALHQVAMELRHNERGSWWSHRLADGAYCKGK